VIQPGLLHEELVRAFARERLRQARERGRVAEPAPPTALLRRLLSFLGGRL
jgi:hypothetical protein